MKRNLKESKGITLVALIITIIVLLILAVVTISAVNEGSLFAHANNAATAYSQKAEEENSILAGYLTKLKKHDGGNESKDNNSEEKWYDVTINNLQNVDWDNIGLVKNNYYAVAFEDKDGNTTLLNIVYEDNSIECRLESDLIETGSRGFCSWIYNTEGDEDYGWSYKDENDNHIDVNLGTFHRVKFMTEYIIDDEGEELNLFDFYTPLTEEPKSAILTITEVE